MTRPVMTEAEHRQRHIELHAAVDELVADYLRQHRGALPSEVSVADLLAWSYQQTLNPTEVE